MNDKGISLKDNKVYKTSILLYCYRNYKKLCEDLQRLHRTEIKSTNKQISAAIVEVSERNKDLVRKYRKEMSLRKKYHNQLVQLKGMLYQLIDGATSPLQSSDRYVDTIYLTPNW